MRVATSTTAIKALILALAAIGSVDAFWRMPCRARSGLARLDPLVSPGTLSQHVHAIHGSDSKFATLHLSLLEPHFPALSIASSMDVCYAKMKSVQ